MKVVFWLLDINPKVDKDNGAVELWLWGIDDGGNRVVIVDRNFVAYFYVLVAEGTDASKISDAIKIDYDDAVVKTDIVERRFFGKPVVAIKVSCITAKMTSKIAKELRNLEGVVDCLEDDIRAAMRYLTDNDLSPCTWYEIDATEEKYAENVRAQKLYVLKSVPKQLDNIGVPPLRVLGFHLICYSREGSPKPDRNPILVLSTVTNSGKERQFIVADTKDDRSIITDFIDYISAFDPDIVVSFGANAVDWAYLRGRCRELGLKLVFDRVGIEPHSSIYGHVTTTGIVNVDLADFMDVFPEVKVHTLWNFAEYLGILKERQDIVENVEFAAYWDDPKKRGALVQFGLDSARKVSTLAGLLLDFAMQLSVLTSLPLDHVMTAAPGFRIEWYLIKRAQKIGELVPRRLEQPYASYAGGLVLSPKPGLHENIAVLDFKSMYPNIMITYNLSPDTYVAPDQPEPPDGVYSAPEVGHRFRKSPQGFYKEALTYLIDVRGAIRHKMKLLSSQSVEFHVLDARQKAVKIITNAAYGYAGWVGARWYLKPVAEAASAWGRHIILATIQMAKKAGLEVIYGDTDSLFIKYDQATAQQLQEDIERELKLEVEIGEVYKRIFFTEAKKRYAGLRADGTLDIAGLEVIRGDWAAVAKKVQEHVLEIILKEQSPKKAADYVSAVVADLRHRKIPLHDLIIWKTLTKNPEKYAIRAPHVEAAKMLKEKGWRLTGGDKVGYVILEGKGPLYSRVKPYFFSKLDEVDVDYYITNQVLPAAMRILGFFSPTEKWLIQKERKEKQGIRSLMDYL